jgi:peptidoglycan/LPS O-acetylase OafA/YrhL
MGRNNNFDGLRLAAALAVVLAHMAALSGREDWLPIAGQTWGGLGVLVFFSISGYLVTASWRNDPDLGRFLAKRFRRIAPGMLVAVSLSFAAVHALGLSGFPDNRFHALNGSLWTIGYEVYCYLLLAALMLGSPHPLAVAACLCALGAVYWPESWLVKFAPFFVLGGLLHEYPLLRRWSWAIAGLGVAVLPYRPLLALALIIPPVTIAIANRSWPVLRDAGRFGDMSYGVYVYAWPIQQCAVALMPGASYAALTAVTMAILAPLAWLSWRYVESPALGRKALTPAPA